MAAKPAVGGNLGYLEDHSAGVEAGEICVCVLSDKFCDAFAEVSFIKTGLGLAHFDRDLSSLFSASLSDGQQQSQHVVA